MISRTADKRGENRSFGVLPTARFIATSVLLNGFNPQFQGEIFTFWVAKLPAHFLSISLLENLQIEWDRARQEVHVSAVAFNVPFQLGERQIIRIKREQAKSAERLRIHLRQALLVLFGHARDCDKIEIYSILYMQRPASATEFSNDGCFVSRKN